MKNILFLVLLFLMASCNPLNKYLSKTDLDYAATITQEDLTNHLTIYASDEFSGRDTGKESGKMAVDYLVSQYKLMGIGAPNGDHTQDVKLRVIESGDATLSISGEMFELGDDFVNFFSADDGLVNDTDFAYIGYGIETENYSSFDGIDIKDKVVFATLGEPMVNDSTFVFSETKEPSKWSSLRGSYRDRVALAQSKGAKSMILLLDDTNYEAYANQFKLIMEEGQMELDVESDESNSFYSFFAGKDIRNAVLPAGQSAGEAKIIDAPIAIGYRNNISPLVAENVVAHIKGSEFPDEYIVLSAHLDHVGIDGEGQIYNGADDDGSGTVAILEIAQAFKQAADEGHPPKRYYVYLIGSDKLSQELHDISEEVNARTMNITLDYTYNDENDPNRFYYRSDHYNFAKNNIPIIFYFNGTHDDYHQPSDTVDKIEFDLLQNRTQLVFYTAWNLANRDNAVVVDPEKMTEVE